MNVARNAALEAEIARTDDAEVYRVYADWLIEQGDPHGELIAVDLAREVDPHHVGLASARDVLLYKHREQWLGALPAQSHVSYRWRRGYIDEVTIDCSELRFADGWWALRALPIASAIRSLEVRGGVTIDELGTLFAVPPPRLATLRIGAYDPHEVGYYDQGGRILNVDELVAPLAASNLLRQLHVLDLSHSIFSDDGGHELLRYAPAFDHLERIEVGETGINLAMVEQLRTRLPHVTARWHPFGYAQ